jgi:4-hydroxy-4-methyl-2-oxoglutarate aldolase
MGGLAQNRGIRGMIVDGAGRDTDELEDINWPIWTRAITPRGTHTMFSGRKEELSINVPILRRRRQSIPAISSSPI